MPSELCDPWATGQSLESLSIAKRGKGREGEGRGGEEEVSHIPTSCSTCAPYHPIPVNDVDLITSCIL